MQRLVDLGSLLYSVLIGAKIDVPTVAKDDMPDWTQPESVFSAIEKTVWYVAISS